MFYSYHQAQVQVQVLHSGLHWSQGCEAHRAPRPRLLLRRWLVQIARLQAAMVPEIWQGARLDVHVRVHVYYIFPSSDAPCDGGCQQTRADIREDETWMRCEM